MKYFSIVLLALVFSTSFFFSDTAYASVSAPTGAAIGAASTSTLGISWGWGGGTETSFDIERSQSNCGGSFVTIATTSTSTLSYTATGLSPELQYCFRVASTNGVATSSYSTTVADFTLANTPLKPTISSVTNTSLQVTIPADGNTPSGALATLYSIQELGSLLYDGYPNGSLTGSQGFTSGAAWNGSLLTSLTPNSPYSFRTVIAYRNSGGGLSPFSPTSLVTYTLASVPASVATSSLSTGSVTFSWTGNGTNYVVSNDTLSQTASTGTTTYVVNGLTCGTAYSFRVASLNHDGATSSYSAAVPVTTPDCSGGTGHSYFYNYGTGNTPLGVSNPVSTSTTSTQSTIVSVAAASSGGGVSTTTVVSTTPVQYPSSSGTSPTVFVKDLHLGSVDPQVASLQIFLNSHGFSLAGQGSGSQGNVTTYFGNLTKAALIKYQTAHSIVPAKGYFGPITRAYVNAQQ